MLGLNQGRNYVFFDGGPNFYRLGSFAKDVCVSRRTPKTGRLTVSMGGVLGLFVISGYIDIHWL